jgi:hypothetical protein
MSAFNLRPSGHSPDSFLHFGPAAKRTERPNLALKVIARGSGAAGWLAGEFGRPLFETGTCV